MMKMSANPFRPKKYAVTRIYRTRPAEHKAADEEKPVVPQGIMTKCPECGAVIYSKLLMKNLKVCECGYYFRMSAYERLAMILDEDSFTETDHQLATRDPLDFPGYADKLVKTQTETGMVDGLVTGKGTIQGMPVYIGVMDASFFMGSMGTVIGEKLARMFERAADERLPVIIYTASGGARMQEGIFSLMQMAKVSAAVAKHGRKGLLYITVLTNPTTGGVTASFAMLGDVILAEPGALIGFAGPRVIEQTIGQKLPDGFQKAEFLLEHGFVDKIVERDKQRDTLGLLLKLHSRSGLGPGIKSGEGAVSEEHRQEAQQSLQTNRPDEKGDRQPSQPDKLTPWEKVKLARMSIRPTGLDYIESVFDDFIELHGDRLYGEDRAIVGGLAFFNGTAVTVIAQQKGRNTKENIARNFSMPHPEGYRKALRLMRQAEKFHRPVICFIDTPGAFCGIGAEERGQGEAIASNLAGMATLMTPIISIVISEGGSGGALALGVADRVYMLEHAVYSILSPEGFASILYKDASKAETAAKDMKLTAQDLYRFGIIDGIIDEPAGGAHNDFDFVMRQVRGIISRDLSELISLPAGELLDRRYMKYRRIM